MAGQDRKKGRIKAYSKSVNAGVIEGEDGAEYRFRRNEIIHGEEPQGHENVVFEEYHAEARNVAVEEKKKK